MESYPLSIIAETPGKESRLGETESKQFYPTEETLILVLSHQHKLLRNSLKIGPLEEGFGGTQC